MRHDSRVSGSVGAHCCGAQAQGSRAFLLSDVSVARQYCGLWALSPVRDVLVALEGSEPSCASRSWDGEPAVGAYRTNHGCHIELVFL